MKAPRLTPGMIQRYTSQGVWKGSFIDSFVGAAAAAQPHGKAVVDRGRTWTFGEVEEAVQRLAGALRGLGVGQGDVVSWQLPNWVEAMLVHHATLRLGAVSNPIVAIYRESEVEFILRQARSKVVFTPRQFRGFDYEEMYAGLRPSLPDLEHVVRVAEGEASTSGPTGFASLLEHEPLMNPPDRDANDVALLLYTSGTTSAPKGVLHTHNTLNLENDSIIDLFGVSATDVVFMPSPLTHITGLLYGVMMPFQVQCPVVLLDVWDVQRAVELIDEHQASWMIGATPFLHGLLTHCTERGRTIPIRVFGCGGADVPPELIRKGREVFGGYVGRVYGSSEAPTVSSSFPGASLDKAATTDGLPIGEVQVKIVDPHGREVGDGVEGEIYTAGPELFLGYLDSRLDVDAFTEDGWFRTGDLGVLDGEGFLTITGRSKDIIIRGGENISAKEIEDIVFEHPKVHEVAIVGRPSPVLQEQVCAFVVVEDGEDLTLEELVAFVGARGIAKQKWPEFLIVKEQMPRTASGKIQKFKLRDEVRQDG